MKRWVAILSGISGALACALSVTLLLITLGWPVKETAMHAWLGTVRVMPRALFTVLAALLIGALGVLTLYGLFSAHFTRRTSATLERSALGETAIAFSALEELINGTVRRRSEVKSVRTKITAVGDTVRMDVRVVTSPTGSLYQLTHALQEEIAAAVLSVCGVPIGQVDVTVDQTDEPHDNRVK